MQRSEIFALLALLVFTAACGHTDNPGTDDPNPTPRMITAVSYVPGAGWDSSKPPEEQALGPHFEYVASEHAAKRLVANGLLTTSPSGLYLIEGDAIAAGAFVDADPGVDSTVLQHQSNEEWSLSIDALAGGLLSTEVVFVLRYRPGETWAVGAGLSEQAIGPHLDFIGAAVGEGKVIGGGPIDGGDSGGMYLLRAASLEAAQEFAASDPGVSSGLFAPTIDGWQAMNVPGS